MPIRNGRKEAPHFSVSRKAITEGKILSAVIEAAGSLYGLASYAVRPLSRACKILIYANAVLSSVSRRKGRGRSAFVSPRRPCMREICRSRRQPASKIGGLEKGGT